MLRDWNGYRDDEASIGDALHVADNVSFRVKRQIMRRPGLGARKTLTAQSMGALETSSDIWIVANNGGTLTGLDLSDDSTFTVKSGLSATPRGNWANAGGQLYFTNGSDAIQVIKSGAAAANAAGIAAPDDAPTAGATGAGSVTAGVHLIRFRWKDSTTGYVSDPSPVLSFTADGSENCPLTLDTTADAKVDQMIIEMTLQAGDDYYVVATVSNASSYTIDVSDTTLATHQLVNVYAGPDGYGHEPPPARPLICEHRGRVFLWGGTDNLLYWSRAGYPEAFNVLDWARNVSQGKADQPAALASFVNDLYIIGSRSMRRLLYTGDPAAGTLLTIPTELGAYNQRCVVMADGAMYGFGSAGAWVVEGIAPQHFSRAIDATWMAEVDEDQSEKFHAFYDPQERAVWFCYVATGDTGPKKAICYELDSRQWTRRTFRNTIQSSITLGQATSTTGAWLGDSDGGYIWLIDDDRVGDGVPTSMDSGKVTAASGSTTTVINVNESLSTSPTLVGTILRDPDSGEERRITANTSSAITVGTAFSSAPTAGHVFHIGSIGCDLISDWTTAEFLNQTMSPIRLQIDHLSDEGSVEALLSLYTDFSASAKAFTVLTATETKPAGVTYDNGDTEAVVDTSVVGPSLPINFKDAKCMRWRLQQEAPEGVFKLLNVRWQFPEDGVTRPRTQ